MPNVAGTNNERNGLSINQYNNIADVKMNVTLENPNTDEGMNTLEMTI